MKRLKRTSTFDEKSEAFKFYSGLYNDYYGRPLNWTKEEYDNISIEDIDTMTEHLMSEMGY